MEIEPQRVAPRGNPVALVYFYVKDRGLEFLTRLAACITTHR